MWFSSVEKGFYVDVGASWPVVDSVTFHFYERGWRGVNIEPDPGEFEELVARRARDVNLQAAVGTGEEPLAFYPSAVRGHGTVDGALAGQRGSVVAIQVPQVSLASIFDEYAPPEGVDFLKVDVEQWEGEVLASADWRRHRPRVVLVEAVDDHGGPSHEEWEPALLLAGYSFGLFDGVNRFYCRDEDAHTLLPRLAAPANVLDNWRPAREVDVQDRLQRRLSEVEAARAAAHEAHAAAREEQAAAREELEQERQAHEGTRLTLASVYASTSWRLTSPVRDASRLAKLMRRGSGG
jgi:FkbM family methyltransferase